jgi:glycosyltransferase involved in cell wall biosynthesis
MTKPKILCISALPPPYHGVSVANDVLLNAKLIQSAYDIKVMPLSKPKLQSGGGLAFATLLADIIVTFKIFLAIIRYRPRLTYLCLSQTPLGLWRDSLWIFLAVLGGSKCLVHMHGGNFRKMFEHETGSTSRILFKSVLSRVAGVIVLDASLANLFEGLIPDQRIMVLRNGIPDYVKGNGLHKDGQDRSERQIAVTYLSNLVPGKGFDIFLEAAALLRKQGKGQGFVFNLAGAPANEQIGTQVKDFVRTQGLGESVRILGKVIGQDKWRLLLNSDVFVFPTQYLPEGQPLVIIEAMAAGLPIISTGRGCIPSLVHNGKNGFIVPDGNALEIGRRLLELQADPQLRAAMGQASRKLYLQHHTVEEFVRGFAAIIDHVLESN